MPSGSRKRKASKKPKPGEPPSSQGEPYELETGLEESMGKNGEGTLEGSPSPKAFEAVAEFGVEEGKELIREASQEEGEVAEAEEASAPDQPFELESKVPAIAEAEEPNGSEMRGEDPVYIEQEYPSPQIMKDIEVPLSQMEPDIEAPPVENKSEVEADAGTTGLERDIDDMSVPPIEIGLIESPVEVGRMADAAREDTGPENDTTAPDIAKVGFEPGVDEEAVKMDAPPWDAQPENDEATVGRDLDTHAASVNIAPDDTPVETDEDLISGQPENDEAVVEMQPYTDAVARNFEIDPGMGAAPVDAEPEIVEDLDVRELDRDTPAVIIEPEATDYASSKTGAETDKGFADVQSELEEAMEQSQPETDAVPSNLEPAAEGEFEEETTQVGEDASVDEIEQEVEPAGPRIEFQRGLSEGEIETMTGLSLGQTEPEVDATLDDSRKDEVAEAETQPEVRATLNDTNQDEGAQADIEPEPEESAFIELGPEGEVGNGYSSLETAADALKEVEPEPERFIDASEEIEGPATLGVEEIVENAEPANEVQTEVIGSEEDLNQGVQAPLEADTQPTEGPTQDVELEDMVEPADEAVMEAPEVSDSKEDFNQGVESPLEAEKEPVGRTTPVYEPEAEAKAEEEAEAEFLEPELELEVPSESHLHQDGPIESNSDQQGLTRIEPNQSNVEDYDQQIQQQEGEADSGIEALELPAGESDQEKISARDEAGLGDAPGSLLDGAPDNAGTGVPAIEQERLEEGELISSQEEVLSDEGVDAEQGAVYAQPDGSKEYTTEQATADVDDLPDQEEALSTEVHRSIVPSEQDTNAQPPPAMTVGEEPHAAEIEFRPTFDDEQELTIDSSTIDALDDSEMVEQGVSGTLPPESDMTANENDPKVDVQNFDSSPGDVERDAGEEDLALSTVAEAGSVINDFDERASYQQLPIGFPSSEQDADIPESRESDNALSLRTPELQIDNIGREFVDISSPRAPELVGMGLTEEVGGDEHADRREDGSKVSGDSPEDEVEWKAAEDLEPIGVHEDVSLKERANEEAAGDGEQNGQGGAAPPIFGIAPALDYLDAKEEALMPKVLPSATDGLRSLPSTGAVTDNGVTPGKEKGIRDNAVVDSNEAEIRTSGEELENASSNGAPLQSAAQERDIQAYRQQNNQEASLPLILPPQDVKQRAVAEGNLKSNDHTSGGGTIQHRTNWLGCCGMFDLLVGKNN